MGLPFSNGWLYSIKQQPTLYFILVQNIDFVYFFDLERVMGIEPTSKAWEAFVLPLNYTRRMPNFTTVPGITQQPSVCNDQIGTLLPYFLFAYIHK